MKKLNLFLCIAAIAISSCNNSTTNSKNTADSTTVTTSASATTTAAPASPAIDASQVSNVNCPVCQKPLVTCTDTTMYQDKLLGFDSKQCDNDFLKNPTAYPIKYK